MVPSRATTSRRCRDSATSRCRSDWHEPDQASWMRPSGHKDSATCAVPVSFGLPPQRQAEPRCRFSSPPARARAHTPSSQTSSRLTDAPPPSLRLLSSPSPSRAPPLLLFRPQCPQHRITAALRGKEEGRGEKRRPGGGGVRGIRCCPSLSPFPALLV
eukprot:2141152-Rhodomonas_salina.2